MKKIEMSLEIARKMYAKGDRETNDWLLENFSKEELEKKEGFTWDDIEFSCGFFPLSDGRIYEAVGITNKGKGFFKTRKQAESAIAFAQLSHIVAKYNEGKDKSVWRWGIYRKNLKLASSICDVDTFHFEFYTEEDAKTSLRVNRELWEQYWMI